MSNCSLFSDDDDDSSVSGRRSPRTMHRSSLAATTGDPMDADDQESWCTTGSVLQAVQALDEFLTPTPESRLDEFKAAAGTSRRGDSTKKQQHDPPTTTMSPSKKREGASPTLESDEETTASDMEHGNVELSVTDFVQMRQEQLAFDEEQGDAQTVDLEGPVDVNTKKNKNRSSPRKPNAKRSAKRVLLLLIGLVIVALALAIAVVMTHMRSSTTSAAADIGSPAINATTTTSNGGGDTGSTTMSQQKAELVFFFQFANIASPAIMSDSQRTSFEVTTTDFFTETLETETEHAMGYQALIAQGLSVAVTQQELHQQKITTAASTNGNRGVQAQVTGRLLQRRLEQQDAQNPVLRVDAVVSANTTVDRVTLTHSLVKLASDYSQDLISRYYMDTASDQDYFASFQSVTVQSLTSVQEDADADESGNDFTSITDIEKQAGTEPAEGDTTSGTAKGLDVTVGNSQLSSDP